MSSSRYRTAKAYVARYEEEVEYLEKEIVRAANWAEEQLAAVDKRLAAVAVQRAAHATLCNAAGQEMLLQREKKVLQMIAVAIRKLQ